jgi:KaiC/GvpD/RAD55 family RecA-like ATPase
LENEISTRLMEVPIGHHYLVLYSDLESMRRVYSNYVKTQIENQPESIIAILPYYDTTDKVREVLESKDIKVRDLERQGSLIILDIVKVIRSQSFDVPDIERLRALILKLENQYPNKTIFIIADMSAFHHLKKAQALVGYEKSLHKDIKVEKWKELCLYHERDFNLMFTDNETKQLLEYHRDKVIQF